VAFASPTLAHFTSENNKWPATSKPLEMNLLGCLLLENFALFRLYGNCAPLGFPAVKSKVPMKQHPNKQKRPPDHQPWQIAHLRNNIPIIGASFFYSVFGQ